MPGARRGRSPPDPVPQPRETVKHASVSEGLVEPRLRALEPLGVERLDRLGGPGDDRLGVLVRLEVREDEVGQRARIAAAGPTDADAQAEKVLRPEVLRDRAEAVVPGE